jgi:hypothetical protein
MSIIRLLLVLFVTAGIAAAQNTVTFDNQSGQSALVKLIGPTSKEVEVPNGAKGRVEASAGRYTIKVRYGTPDQYRYTKGEEFEVKETASTQSAITITLHKVVAGNYDSRSISEADFEADTAVKRSDSAVLTSSYRQEKAPKADTASNAGITLQWAEPLEKPTTVNLIFTNALPDITYTLTSQSNLYVSIVMSVRSSDGLQKNDFDCFTRVTNRAGRFRSTILMMGAGVAAENADITGKTFVSVAVYSTSKGSDNKTVRETRISNVVTAELYKSYSRPALMQKQSMDAMYFGPQ